MRRGLVNSNSNVVRTGHRREEGLQMVSQEEGSQTATATLSKRSTTSRGLANYDNNIVRRGLVNHYFRFFLYELEQTT